MTAQNLKNSILQMAVQGRLVPQQVSNGTAAELLKKIDNEKSLLVQEGKIKKDKNSSVICRRNGSFYEKKGKVELCIDDELPFAIPASWEWVKLGNIVWVNPRNIMDDNMSAGFMPMPLLSAGYINKMEFEIKAWKEIKKGYTHFANGDVVVAKITPCFQNRKSAIIENLSYGYGAGTTELHVLRCYGDTIVLEYLLWFVKTEYFIRTAEKKMTGTAGQQRVGTEVISDFLFPLPPLAEQQRIVDRLNELLPKCEDMAKLGA